MRPKLLITGAAGRVGRTLTEALADEYELLLFDRIPIATRRANVANIAADLSDGPALERAMRDVGCVIHLAAIPEESPFEDLVRPNILGTYAVFEAARRAGVERVIFASSIQAVGFHRMECGVAQDSRIRPSGFYGVTKAFGEALASLYADKFGISVACLRIASFEPEPQDQRHLSTWLSPADCVRLFRACIEAPRFSFIMAYGVSANEASIVSDAVPSAIDYRPRDNAESFRSTLAAVSNTAAVLFAGGEFCGRDFIGDFGRVK
ncbi:MAG: NAD-dependent epimerase/dehydratase family protein [Steroidobacteraceae bacterium]